MFPDIWSMLKNSNGTFMAFAVAVIGAFLTGAVAYKSFGGIRSGKIRIALVAFYAFILLAYIIIFFHILAI